MRKGIFSDGITTKEVDVPIGVNPIFDEDTGFSFVYFTRVKKLFGKNFSKEGRFYFDFCRL